MSKTTNTHTACIAVLPFENFIGGRQNDYFSIGFVEEIITDLAHFPNLQVISSYTSRKIGADDRGEMDVAEELAIDYLLKGNLLQQGNLLRIYTQLIQVPKGSVVWAERYDAPMDTIFDIQDDIVERVVGAVSVQINWVLLSAARNKSLTSLAAYDCWLRGMEHLRRKEPDADKEARRLFRQALEIDIQCGKIMGIDHWKADSFWHTPAFPDLTFLQLVFGRRRSLELAGMYVDCNVDDTSATVLDALFPPFKGTMWLGN